MASDNRRQRGLASAVTGILMLFGLVSSVRADEIWVQPTDQQDLGGLGIGSSLVWPATVAGAVRLAWGVPNDLQTFESAKMVLIPHSPGGAATLNVLICRAQRDRVERGDFAPGLSASLPAYQISCRVDISADVSPISARRANYLAVLAYTTPTTATDHIVGMRFLQHQCGQQHFPLTRSWELKPETRR